MDRKEALLKDLVAVLKIPSVKQPPLPGMPFGRSCFEALDAVLKMGKDMGFAVKNVDGYAGHIEWGEGPLFGILGHLDVVPAGQDWTSPAFAAEIREDCLYARGTQDDKGPMLAVLHAMKRLKDEGFCPKRRLRLILGCDEESGWGCINYYFQKEEMPEEGFSPDADFPLINCEKGVLHLEVDLPFSDLPGRRLEALSGGERVNMVPDFASARLDGEEVVCRGISAHGSTPEQGDNALQKLLDELIARYPHPALKTARALSALDGSGAGVACADEVSGSLTLNLGKAELGEGKLRLWLDIRYPVTREKAAVLSGLRAASGGEVIVLNEHAPLYVPEETPLVQKLLRAYERVTGTPGRPFAVGGATFARALKCGVAFGPVFPGTHTSIHQRDENIPLKELWALFDIYTEALREVLS